MDRGGNTSAVRTTTEVVRTAETLAADVSDIMVKAPRCLQRARAAFTAIITLIQTVLFNHTGTPGVTVLTSLSL